MIPMFALTWVWGAPALAAGPAAVGLPLGQLDALGLEPPTVPHVEPLSMRYPLASGDGFVIVVVRPAEDQASTAFDGMARTLATHWPPPAPGVTLPGDRALGDGVASLLMQSDNAVVFVRHHRGRASEVASRVLGALTRDEADCAGQAQLLDGRAADGCGRPR